LRSLLVRHSDYVGRKHVAPLLGWSCHQNADAAVKVLCNSGLGVWMEMLSLLASMFLLCD
jgi:hypothetical protein